MSEDESERKISRRAALKTSALSIGLVTGTTGLATARKRSYRETIQASHKILQNAGPEAQAKFLQNNGVAVARSGGRARLTPDPSEDGVNTQDSNFSAGDDATFYFSLYQDCNSDGYHDGTYTAEFAWNYDAAEFLDDSPLDIAAISWERGWDYEDYDTNQSLYTSHDDVWYRSGSSGEGPAFNVRDINDMARDGYWWCGVHLNAIGDYDYDQRILAAAYSHTWTVEGDPYIDSVSVGYPPGISISFKDSEDEARKKTVDRTSSGELFRENQHDASPCYYY